MFKKNSYFVFILALLVSVPCFSGSSASQSDSYGQRKAVQAFIDEMVSEHQFSADELQAWFDSAEKKQSIIDAISRPAEKVKPWKDYRKIFITDKRIKQGVQFWQENSDTLKKVENRYQVDAEIIVAIIGVETSYGRNKGSYRVIDALSTLAFDYPPRSSFFRKQLAQFFLLAREQQRNPLELKGSYAGAMGYGQFIPSSYRHYAKDFDGDEFADIWDNPADAIASVANYFKEHHWQKGRMVATRVHIKPGYDDSVFNTKLKPAFSFEELQKHGIEPIERGMPDEIFAMHQLEGKYGAEFWAGAKNFYVITRYNHSNMYALAAYQLSQAIKIEYQKTLP